MLDDSLYMKSVLEDFVRFILIIAGGSNNKSLWILKGLDWFKWTL